jgi:hypothetical protein
MTRYVICNPCQGSGTAGSAWCKTCGGLGKIAQRLKRVLPSSRHAIFFRGALINPKHKVTK